MDVLSQGVKSCVKSTLGEPIFNLGGAGRKGCQGVKARRELCRLEIFNRLKTFVNIVAPRGFPTLEGLLFGCQCL